MPRFMPCLALPLLISLAGCATHAPAGTSTPAQQSAPAAKSEASSGAGKQATAGGNTHPTAEIKGRNAAGFDRWVAGFRRQAAARGVSAATLNLAFSDTHYLPHVIELDHRQPEFTRSIWDYLDTAVSPTRITHGRRKLAEYRDVADPVAARYGVPGSIITAIWGMESNYGGNFGHYQTIDALATLGYDGRRRRFAEKQLYAAMDILANGDISRNRMRGSWAGGMGNTQFLPTSFLAYAVDGDGDGRRDIWGSIPDTMSSTANYLAKNGWRRGETWGREVALPPGFNYSQTGGKVHRSTAAWRAAGVRPVDSRGMPDFSSAAILAPAGASGPAFIVGPNFRAILRYNNAISYALAVGLLSDQIKGEPGVQRAWPRGEGRLTRQQILILQRNLNKLGYATGTPDGKVGPNTRSGIRAFQQAHGLVADGFPSRGLLHKVTAASGT